MSKSPNKHNGLYMEARPLEEGLGTAIDDGRIGPRDDPKMARDQFESAIHLNSDKIKLPRGFLNEFDVPYELFLVTRKNRRYRATLSIDSKSIPYLITNTKEIREDEGVEDRGACVCLKYNGRPGREFKIYVCRDDGYEFQHEPRRPRPINWGEHWVEREPKWEDGGDEGVVNNETEDNGDYDDSDDESFTVHSSAPQDSDDDQHHDVV